MFVEAEAALMRYKTTSSSIDNHTSMNVISTVSKAGSNLDFVHHAGNVCCATHRVSHTV